MACVKRLFNFTLVVAIAFVASLWFIAKAQTADSKPKATASITGRVTIGEKPAPGVTVAVGTMTFPQVLVGQTVSDGEGKYRISGLIPGQITVSAAAPTFVVPVDCSSEMEATVSAAFALAKKCGADVHLLEVPVALHSSMTERTSDSAAQ